MTRRRRIARLAILTLCLPLALVPAILLLVAADEAMTTPGRKVTR